MGTYVKSLVEQHFGWLLGVKHGLTKSQKSWACLTEQCQVLHDPSCFGGEKNKVHKCSCTDSENEIVSLLMVYRFGRPASC